MKKDFTPAPARYLPYPKAVAAWQELQRVERNHKNRKTGYTARRVIDAAFNAEIEFLRGIEADARAAAVTA